MKHLGDITKINGALIEPVDCITFGSPCQNLSVAGNRKGLEGSESGLFVEAIRVIKEMRENDRRLHPEWADDMVRPKFAIWENVPGAFSSNSGNDFATVLEILVGIKEEGFSLPRPYGRWTNAGCIIGEDWSIAWRTMDAQYWGVPQRRKRIALVMDFTGGVPDKYSLSPKACQGILTRASRRGKELPDVLKRALENVIAQHLNSVTQDQIQVGGYRGINSEQHECDTCLPPRPDTFLTDRNSR